MVKREIKISKICLFFIKVFKYSLVFIKIFEMRIQLKRLAYLKNIVKCVTRKTKRRFLEI